MNRDQIIKDRNKYLNKLRIQLKDKFPEALDFYKNPDNLVDKNTPIIPIKQNSRKGLTMSKSVLTESALRHLLKRTKPGISASEFNTFKNLNKEQIVDMLLTEETLPLPVNNYNNGDDIYDNTVPFGETFINAPYDDTIEGDRTVTLKTWMVEELTKESTSMHSTMWLFWHNHLVTELWGIFNGRMSYNYLNTLHARSFGNFKEMVREISKSPAMLIYLNTIANNKDAPDENFGRELQELFCIGKGKDANYTESDVQAAARVMTGWNIDWDNATPTFYSWDHETADKQFSAFYGNKVIKGKTGQAGKEELDEMIEMIFETNEVAPFICRKLYTFFCYATIDDWTEENIIQPLANTFRDNNYNIKPVLAQLLNSDHFYDEVNYGAIIKNPVEVLVGWWRTMKISFPFPESDIHNKMLVYRSMFWSMTEWGMQLGDPPNVAGWPAYYQFPTYDKTWVTTSTIVKRIAFVDVFLYWGFWSPNHVVTMDILEYAKTLTNPSDPNAIIDEIQDLYYGLKVNEQVRLGLKSILLSGQAQDYYWTDAWNSWFADQNNEGKRTIVFNRLRYLFQRMFNLSEFQLK